jgi:hypothetical protein
VTDTSTITLPQPVLEGHGETIAWLEQEFPGWSVDVNLTTGWSGTERHLWIASQTGHHPQSELSAAKLHTRVTEYLERGRLRTSRN